ncbi:MAG: RNA polymerase sigma factor [Myxococcaceae bacterium]|nr:RNA polymerase sigma factor [Myxococcaceae bacterium]
MKVHEPRNTSLSVVNELRADAMETEPADVRALYFMHRDAVRLTLRRLTGAGPHLDDLLHDVFVVALRDAARLLAAESPRAWLYGIAVRLAANHRRRAWLRSWLGLEAAAEVESADDPVLALRRREAEAQLETALAAMPAKKRELFVLFELEGLSGAELAAALDIPLGTVWRRLHDARNVFAAALARLGGTP